MITYKAVVISSNKRKDGTYPVKIRVTFKQKSRRLPTSLVCKAQDLTRSLHIKNAEILRKADLVIREMREVADNLSPFTLEGWDIDQVVDYIKRTIASRNAKASFTLDFYDYAQRYAQSKGPHTCVTYLSAVNAFREFRQNQPTDINDITRQMLREFLSWCEKNGKHRRSDNPQIKGILYVRTLGYAFKQARKEFNDADEETLLIPRNPFENLSLPRINFNGQRNIGVKAIQFLIERPIGTDLTAYTIYAFMLSFCTMGANAADIYTSTPEPGSEWWIYNRRKTSGRRADKAQMRVRMTPQADYYLRRLLEMGRPDERFCSSQSFGSAMNLCLKRLNEPQIPDFSFYAARHSWASIARSIGIEKATIDECLAHIGDYKVADIYAERNWDLINEANAKVLALFDWNALSL